jgi:hypothetical protein
MRSDTPTTGQLFVCDEEIEEEVMGSKMMVKTGRQARYLRIARSQNYDCGIRSASPGSVLEVITAPSELGAEAAAKHLHDKLVSIIRGQ